MSSLLHVWREAFCALPELHSIQRVQFDLSCWEPLELRHIVRFLQEISTVMYMKARRNRGVNWHLRSLGAIQGRRNGWKQACQARKWSEHDDAQQIVARECIGR
jgi:hypothetical protein